MKQAVMTAPGAIEFRDVPVPIPGPGEVLLRIQRIGVCGSDVHVYHGKHPYTKYPVVQGHEYSASVEAAGGGDRPGVGHESDFHAADRVRRMRAVQTRRLPHLRQAQSRRVPGAGLCPGAVGHERGQDHPAARPLQLRAGRTGGAGLVAVHATSRAGALPVVGSRCWARGRSATWWRRWRAVRVRRC